MIMMNERNARLDNIELEEIIATNEFRNLQRMFEREF